jgi:hypothetical protein
MTMLTSFSSAGGSRFDHWCLAGTVLRLGSPILIAIGVAFAIRLGLPLDARAKTALTVFAGLGRGRLPGRRQLAHGVPRRQGASGTRLCAG